MQVYPALDVWDLGVDLVKQIETITSVKNIFEEEFIQNNYLIWSRKGIGLRRFEFWRSCPDLRFSSDVTSFPPASNANSFLTN